VGSEALAEAKRGGLARAWHFLTVEVPGEVRKVTWPTWPELKKATAIIVVFVSVLGLVIGWLDVLLQYVLVSLLARIF